MGPPVVPATARIHAGHFPRSPRPSPCPATGRNLTVAASRCLPMSMPPDCGESGTWQWHCLAGETPGRRLWIREGQDAGARFPAPPCHPGCGRPGQSPYHCFATVPAAARWWFQGWQQRWNTQKFQPQTQHCAAATQAAKPRHAGSRHHG